MQNNIGPYWEDVERNRIFTVAQIYDRSADELNPDLKESSLRGSLILFYGMYDERNKEKLLSESDFKQLFEKAKVMKKELWAL